MVDEFREKKQIKNVLSTCGTYLFSVAVSHHKGSSLGIIRILTLIQHNQDPNDALKSIIDDIFKGYSEIIPSIAIN